MKLLLQCDGSRRLSGDEFQAIGPPTEKARRPNVFRRKRRTVRKLRLADRKCCNIRTSNLYLQTTLYSLRFEKAVKNSSKKRSEPTSIEPNATAIRPEMMYNVQYWISLCMLLLLLLLLLVLGLLKSRRFGATA